MEGKEKKGNKRENLKMVQKSFAGTIFAAACCNALLPVPADSFLLSPLSPISKPSALTRMDRANSHFGLRLRGGECTPPPAHAVTSMQTHAGCGNEALGSKLFAVEGLIGAGKSTLLSKLREQEGVAIIPEPLEKWQETGIFEAFYKDMTRWSFTFQLAAFVSRVQAAEKALEFADSARRITSLIGERSWCADAYVFEPLLHRDGHISGCEHATYQDWWRWVEAKSPQMAGIIYLRARPETCLARIQKRQRQGEAGIPLVYLQGLFDQHEQWLIDKVTWYGRNNVPVLVLDADVEFESDMFVSEKMLQQILEFTADPHRCSTSASTFNSANCTPNPAHTSASACADSVRSPSSSKNERAKTDFRV